MIDEFDFRIELIFPFEVPVARLAAEAAVHAMIEAGVGVAPALLSGEVADPSQIGRLVERGRRQTFHLTFPTASVVLGRVRNHDHSCLLLDFRAGEDLDWGSFVRRFAVLAPIVSARVVDWSFEYWQNAFDPIQFRYAGRSMAGLPMRSNGLPPPLTQAIVDTSQNPGRRVLRAGYVEAVGNRMWLGDEFFRRVPRSSRKLLLERGPAVSESAGILQLVASHETFSDTTPRKFIDDLRELVFPRAPE